MNESRLNLSTGLIALYFFCTGCSSALGAGQKPLLVRYLSPLPDSKYILPVTNIIVRTDGPIADDAAQGLIRVISGTLSGIHSFAVRVSDDGRTVVCQPATPFSLSEGVTVLLDTSIARCTGPAQAGSFTFWIAPSYVDPTALRAKLRASDFPESVSARKQALRTRPAAVTDGIVLPVIDVTVSEATSPGYLFLSNLNWSYASVPALLILRDDGSQVFARDLENNGYDFKPQPNGMLTYYDDGPQEFLEMDQTCTVIDTFHCGNGYGTDPHELRILPNGHALLFGVDNEIVDMSRVVPGGYTAAKVVGYVIQELDQKKNVVFQWRTMDHFSITDATGIDFTATWIDYAHCNAIDADTDGNLLLSTRHFNEITKISRETGDMMWRLGGKNNQFRFVNDSVGFSYQHAVRRIDNGNITLFDNGDFHVPPYSRAVEYAVDTARKTATLVWQYRNTPDVFGYAMGFVQRLQNGNTLIGWGAGNPTVTEVSPSGNKVFEMTFDDGVYSYRAFRYNWQPVISSAPRVGEGSPVSYALSQNYPNPFNPSTVIRYALPGRASVVLEVFNTLGQQVATLASGTEEPGFHEVRFDASGLASGMYFYRLAAHTASVTTSAGAPAGGSGDFVQTRKLLLVR